MSIVELLDKHWIDVMFVVVIVAVLLLERATPRG